MDVSEFVLDIYAELFEIEEKTANGRLSEAISHSDRLLEALAVNESVARSHPNFHLLKREFSALRSEALQISRYIRAKSYVAYGAQLIRTNPFVAVIHLGGDLATREFPQIDSLRINLHEIAYEEYLNGNAPKKADDPLPENYIGQAY